MRRVRSVSVVRRAVSTVVVAGVVRLRLLLRLSAAKYLSSLYYQPLFPNNMICL